VARQKLKWYDDPGKVGQRIRAAREAAGLSQRDLATESCTAAYISRIEKGERVPSIQLMREFASRLGLSEEYLATGASGAAARSFGLAEARVALRLGEFEDALRLPNPPLDRARSDADRALVSAFLGELALAEGDQRGAIDALERAFKLDGSLEEREPNAIDALGRAYARAAEYESAVAAFTGARDRAAARGDLLNEVRFGSLLAHAYTDSGNFPAAEAAVAGALQAADGLDDPLTRARTLWARSRVHALQNDPETAALYAEQALEILEVSDHSYYAALANQLLAHIELDRGNADRAVELLENAAPAIEASGRKFEYARLEIERARALLSVGRGEEAASVAMTASAALRGELSVDAGRCFLLVADVFRELNDDERALELYELAVESLQQMPTRYLVEAYSKLADLLESRGEAGKALSLLKEAMKVQVVSDRMLSPRGE
jgi:transcriptional regulator with XRE-family HTH domain